MTRLQEKNVEVVAKYSLCLSRMETTVQCLVHRIFAKACPSVVISKINYSNVAIL